MRTSTICLTVLSAAATTLASARPDTSYLAHNIRALSDTLYKRQAPTIPPQCASTCDPVYDQTKDGCSVSSCCTQDFEASYYKCIVCVGENADDLKASDIADAQDDFDSLYVFCYNNGSPLQEITLPGQDPSRSLSTSSPTSHATSTSKSTSSPTSVSNAALKTTDSPSSTVKPSSTSTTPSSSHETETGSGRAASSTPKSGGASLGVSAGESGLWALAAAIVGLVVI